tara:strand:- start:139 stop:372 length:234 start_codon:yes stop_codon:yes gene_type:complete
MAYKKSKVELDGVPITIKVGALHRSLKVPASYTFKKSELERLNKKEIGSEFMFKKNKIKMTPLLKKRLTLGINLMKK